MRSVLY